ncbi:MAG: serine/threonine protein kinase, partial [Candidatus Obscuribacterales bacterium]|nr:serine/threonine protein kinase [Candidatus Obscuribacterales bacterium]
MTYQPSNTGTGKNRPHPMLGAQLGQYKILDVVGGGGMGIVFRARQEMVDRDVALKLLPPDLAQDDVNKKRLEREAKALAKLNHPNIVTTFEFGLTPYGQAYLVMELVDGECLKGLLLRENRLELGRALKMFIQIADAMRFAHQNGIVHRDLKPHNVMVARVPTADFIKVLDFGIARLAQDSQMLTRAGEIIGSPLYMSPEQCLSDPVDERTDVYALGVLMYQCLTGVVPFKGETLYETVEMKCTHPIPRFTDVAPHVEVPNFLEELIRHCLAVEPEKRFQSMDELKDLLESLPVAPKRSVPMEATAVLGNSAARKVIQEASSTGSRPKTIRERMKEKPAEAPPQPSQSATSTFSGQSRMSTSRSYRPTKEEKPAGFVLTPTMLAIGVLVILVMLLSLVIVALGFYNMGVNSGVNRPGTHNSGVQPTVSQPSIQQTAQPPQPVQPMQEAP